MQLSQCNVFFLNFSLFPKLIMSHRELFFHAAQILNYESENHYNTISTAIILSII